ncbi:MAG: TIGR00153 family protein [Candidatus Eisenbacteria bacterium]|uniref:TIGR00153 family protein n=1 Tax=Eiseniibacteriota bacterium TaxID=2212470 RepID=A0A948W7Y8_UNCEI|nr:TIGR00153 family protein [Candidatus Eisenbacteria bacterium]MBU1948307.1 TIGR00153 family protein [Candidatus Eisenbacteria bacterium]MBU2693099.1 TIGR00153 family protein [Candidatus Eisenbacteria bacterium]
MRIMRNLFGSSPFGMLVEHTRKVHDCVLLMKPLAEALLAEDWDRIKELHHKMSRTEHEADLIKGQIRDQISHVFLMSVGKYELMQFLAVQDDVADSAEDFSVVLMLRKTKVPEELRGDFLALVDQVIKVSEDLLGLAEELSQLSESAFTGEEAKRVLDSIDNVVEEEWKADKLQRVFAKHYYDLEDQLDPTTLFFYDKYCKTLSSVANNAERTAKFLRLIIGKR